MNIDICVNTFAKRQTPESGFSHYDGPIRYTAWHAWCYFEDRKPGYREGVVTVPVPASHYYAGIVTLKAGDKLAGEFKPRRPGESPRKHYEAVGRTKMPAVSVELVLYSSKVLAEGGDNDLPAEDGNWEVVSINASPCEGDQPIEPSVLLANHFNLDGGTSTGMTAEELVAQLAVSVPFWADKAPAQPKATTDDCL